MAGSGLYLGICVENPIQHEVSLYAALSADPRLRIKVLYFSKRGLEPFRPYGLEQAVRHEIPLLDGYDYEFLGNISPWQSGPLMYLNPDIVSRIREENFDAVLIYGYIYPSCLLALAAARRLGIPVLLRLEAESILPRPLWKRLLRRTLFPALYRRIDGFLVMGYGNRQHYREFGVPEERLFYAPQTVDQAFFRTGPGAERIASLRRELGFDEQSVLFIYTSKHRTAKRPLDAVVAMCHLPAHIDAGLLMLGDGPLRPTVEDYARKYDKYHRVRFLGYRPLPEMRDYMHVADVLILPSIENFGTTLYQGLAAGLAILASDQVVAWLDVVRPGVNGLVYRAGWIDALAAHIEALARDRDLVNRMRLMSRQMSSEFTLRICVDSIVQAVYSVCGQSVRQQMTLPVERV